MNKSLIIQKSKKQEKSTILIKLHHLKPASGSKKQKTRVGRGEGSKGKTSTRGNKGTKARKNVSLGFAGGQLPVHMRIPKLRGMKNKKKKIKNQVLNLDKIVTLYPNGGKVTLDDLIKKRALRNKILPFKILGSLKTNLNVILEIYANSFSSCASKKIIKAGGTIKLIQ